MRKPNALQGDSPKVPFYLRLDPILATKIKALSKAKKCSIISIFETALFDHLQSKGDKSMPYVHLSKLIIKTSLIAVIEWNLESENNVFVTVITLSNGGFLRLESSDPNYDKDKATLLQAIYSQEL